MQYIFIQRRYALLKNTADFSNFVVLLYFVLLICGDIYGRMCVLFTILFACGLYFIDIDIYKGVGD